jgi:hypothetical protein
LRFEFFDLGKQVLHGYVKVFGKAWQTEKLSRFFAVKLFVQPDSDFVEFAFA